eukprot:8609714-Ditylum_brightwellii.AAC.1
MTVVKCPCCAGQHDHGPQPGHHVALCKDEHQDLGLFIGDRCFVPNCGYAMCECEEGDRVNGLIVPDNLLDYSREPN